MFSRLESDVLDRTFERYGNFIEPSETTPGATSFFGNFQTHSHVFNITTDDAYLIERLSAGILRNKARADYLAQPTVEEQEAAIEASRADRLNRLARR